MRGGRNRRSPAGRDGSQGMQQLLDQQRIGVGGRCDGNVGVLVAMIRCLPLGRVHGSMFTGPPMGLSGEPTGNSRIGRDRYSMPRCVAQYRDEPLADAGTHPVPQQRRQGEGLTPSACERPATGPSQRQGQTRRSGARPHRGPVGRGRRARRTVVNSSRSRPAPAQAAGPRRGRSQRSEGARILGAEDPHLGVRGRR